MNKLYLLFLATAPLLSFDLGKYKELYDECLFLSKEITFFNKDKAIKVDLPKLLEDYLVWKATQESEQLLKELKDGVISVENIFLRKK